MLAKLKIMSEDSGLYKRILVASTPQFVLNSEMDFEVDTGGATRPHEGARGRSVRQPRVEVPPCGAASGYAHRT